MQVFVSNAWFCARRVTDRDLENFNVNARICAHRSTDRDLVSVFVKRKVNARIADNPQPTDRDFETKKWILRYVHRRTTDLDPALDKKSAMSVTSVISCGYYCFWS